MIVIGLTGSIAMGKTTVANQFAALGVPVLDSDKVVHRLLAGDKQVIDAIHKHFPATFVDGKISRQALGKEVLGDDKALTVLEHILHPRVRQEQQHFIRSQKKQGEQIVLLDIPLLFETDAQERCDYTVVVSAPPIIQAARALRRPGMTKDRLERVLSRQMPDAHKRRRADFIVLTGLGKKESLRQVKKILNTVRQKNHA